MAQTAFDPQRFEGRVAFISGVGAFRAAQAFDWAVQYLRTRRVDVRPLLSAQIPLSRSLEAFELAADRSRSTKVQVIAD